MTGNHQLGWLDAARNLSVLDVATRLGIEVKRTPSSHHCACPACGAERRHQKSGDRRGSVGIPVARPHTWHCFTCDAAGDAIDFAAHRLSGDRFRSLQEAGKAAVREFFQAETGFAVQAAPRPRTDLMPVAWENAETKYPPRGEVLALWSQCDPLNSDAECAAYLKSRGVHNLAEVAEHDAARALRPGASMPGWASYGGRTWEQTGHRIIVPLYDFVGNLTSVLARTVDVDKQRVDRKSVGAKGYQRRGLVIAGSYGLHMLVKGNSRSMHGDANFTLTIAEGEKDTLRFIADGADGEVTEDYRPIACKGVLGIVSGAFTRDIASRVPSGSHVVLATDADEAGDKYAEQIKALVGDRVTYERKPPKEY